MPARPKRFMKCGHVGFGEYCHRCFEADALQKKLDLIDPLNAFKEEAAAKAAHELKERIDHLRGPSRRTFERKGGAPS